MKHHFTSLLPSLLTIFLLAGCASTSEKTDEMLSGGRVDDALTFIERERTKTPTDGELINLERKVRTQWVSDKLIQVRLERLAGNKGSSIELMRKILKNEELWSILPGGAVYSTQAEETAYLAEFLQARIFEAAAKNKPLEATFRYREDRVLLENDLKVETSKLKSAIADSSRRFCQGESRRVLNSDHYSALFLKKSCDELGVRITLPKTTNSVKLFGALAPDLKLTKVPPQRISDFSRDLKAEFEKSIWYDARVASTLPMTLSGPLEEKIDTRSVYRSKPYTVRVPYEEKSIRKKEEKSGLSVAFEVLAWVLVSEHRPNREIANADGTVTVYETKYRDETRDYDYTATEVTQTLSVDWKIDVAPRGRAHEFQFKEVNRVMSDEHNISFAAASLYPQTRTIVKPADWVASLNRKLMDRIGSEFHQTWIEQFCTTLGKDDAAELQHRCIYGADATVPAFHADWFLKTYGIEIENWRRLVAVGPVRETK